MRDAEERLRADVPTDARRLWRQAARVQAYQKATGRQSCQEIREKSMSRPNFWGEPAPPEDGASSPALGGKGWAKKIAGSAF